jgi:N-methylhydantoinase A
MTHGDVRLAIDIGGTFTDLAAYHSDRRLLTTAKVPSTFPDPSVGALDGVRQLAEKDLTLAAISTVIHGTTLVANALIERRGATIGLLATSGFRDLLHFVGRELRYDIYDPTPRFPEPLVPRRMRDEVVERVAADGTVVVPLDIETVRAATARQLGAGVEAIAVSLLHSYANPIHEIRVREIIQSQAPGLPISLSHEVLPQIREYERTSATVINAYVQPLISRYLHRLEKGLQELGISAELLLMTSSGGTLPAAAASRFPIQLVESGPAAGTVIAAAIGEHLEIADLLSFDMGGTTAKMCTIRGNSPVVTKNHEVARVRRFRKGSGLPLGIPVIDLLEIGAGGGSIAEIDSFGLLQVGPHSAGSVPGPACYGRGGDEPTVTDADLLLGFVNPDSFLGGEVKLSARRAAKAVRDKIGGPLKLGTKDAAAAIARVVNENMAEAARVHAVELNIDIRRFPIVAFGGCGPAHAYAVAHRLDSPAVICPPNAGVLSAVGLLLAPMSGDASRSYPEDLERLSPESINDMLDELEQQALSQLGSSLRPEDIEVEIYADMCYVGQGFEVATRVPFRRTTEAGLRDLKSTFDETYEAAYGRRLADLPARCVTWRVIASGGRQDVAIDANGDDSNGATGESKTHPSSSRAAFFLDHGVTDCPVFLRRDLAPTARLAGPALIDDTACTIAVPPSMDAEVDGDANVILRWRSHNNTEPNRPTSLGRSASSNPPETYGA